MSGQLLLLALLSGCAMLVLGIAGLSLVSRSKAQRRNQLVLTLEELLGSRLYAARERELRIAMVSRALVVLGALTALVAYLRL